MVMLQKKSEALAEQLKQKSLADLPWTQIMEFIMQMVQMCFPSAASFRETRTMGPGRQAALGVYIRRELGIRGRRRVNDVRSTILEEINAASEEEMDQAWLEAKQELEPIDYVSPL